MQYRRFGRTGWHVSEIGYGMWGMGGWTGSDDDESLRSLDLAVSLGCDFFDTAWAYGTGRSERLLGQTIRAHHERPLYIATKVPPKNMKWPGRGDDPVDGVFPPDHIREYTERSLDNLGVTRIDLQQFHVWSDAWAGDDRWVREVSDLKREGLIRAFGISVNRWEPENVLLALDTGIVDSVQVVYNVFDQAPEDRLFPACQARNIAVIARVPFDEGSLTGSLTRESSWPEEDWRNIYFRLENLEPTVERVEALHAVIPAGMDLSEVALRFVLQHPAVSTTIPGMRRPVHVRRNLEVSDGRCLSEATMRELGRHRWDRSLVIE